MSPPLSLRETETVVAVAIEVVTVDVVETEAVEEAVTGDAVETAVVIAVANPLLIWILEGAILRGLPLFSCESGL